MNTIAILGAGTMGSALAETYAKNNFEVKLLDNNSHALLNAKSNIKKSLDEGIKKHVITNIEKNKTLNNIIFTNDMNELKNSELVIEAVTEDIHLKRKLFLQLEGICPKEAIFATNTSSLLVSKIGEVLKNS